MFRGVAIYAIQADAKANHVKLRFGKPLDAGRIENMSQNRILQYPGDPFAHRNKPGDLASCKIIFCRILTGSQMRKYRLNTQVRILYQACGQQFKLRFNKTEPVHAGIHLDVNAHLLLDGSLVSCNGLFKQIEDVQVVNFGLQVVFQQRIEALFFGTHHHDGKMNAGFTKLHPFIGIGHRQVINPVILQHVGDFETPAAVREGLYHGHGFRPRP